MQDHKRRVHDNNLDAVLKAHGIPIGELRKQLNKGLSDGDPEYVKQSTLSCYVVHGGGVSRPEKPLAKRIAAVVSKLTRKKYSVIDLFPHFGHKRLGIAVVLDVDGEMVAEFGGEKFRMVR